MSASINNHVTFDVMKNRKRIEIRLVVKPYHDNNYGVFFESADGRPAGFYPYPGLSRSSVIAIASRMAQRSVHIKQCVGYRRNTGEIRRSYIKREMVTEKVLDSVIKGIRRGHLDTASAALRMAVDNKQFKAIKRMTVAARQLLIDNYIQPTKAEKFLRECDSALA